MGHVNNITSLLAISGAILLWSASYVATKIAYAGFGPFTISLVRFVISSSLLLTIWRLAGSGKLPAKPLIKQVASSALLGITLYFVFENLGCKYTTASNCSLLVAAFPALTTLLELLIYRKKLTQLACVGIGTAFVGVALIVVSQGTGGAGENDALGMLMLLCAGVVWAFYSFQMTKITGKVSTFEITVFQCCFGALFFIPLAPVDIAQTALPTPPVIASLAYLTLGCSVVAYFLYNWGLQKVSASTAVVLLNLEPVFGIVWSALILGEQLSMLQILGGAVVILGVFFSARGQGGQETEPLCG